MSGHRQYNMLVNGLGAILRAFAISFCIMMPALFLAPKADSASSLILIISLLAGSLVWMEYTNTYPSIIEFRDCRPFNRIRFLNGALLILLISRYLKSVLEQSAGTAQGEFFRFITDMTQGFDVLYSLVSPMTLHFSQAVQPALQGMGFLALVLVITTVLPFAIWTFVTNWPMSRNDFNVWTNLPFLEPNKSPNLAARLRASGYFNVVVGLAFPLFFPAAVGVFAPIYLKGDVFSLQETVWVFVLWGGMPVSLIMRGFAILSVSKGLPAKAPQNLENAV